MMVLYTVAWPPQGIYSKKPITAVADMKGLKWRAYSPATSKIAELVGAQPVTVQAAELSQAMATGVVDSYMSSGSTGYDTKTYEQHQVLVRHPGLAAQERGHRQQEILRRAGQAHPGTRC
jgi:TRAP-type C4-dicarboxylate transport system substrate-binding protein